jgi:hypothetical protein
MENWLAADGVRWGSIGWKWNELQVPRHAGAGGMTEFRVAFHLGMGGIGWTEPATTAGNLISFGRVLPLACTKIDRVVSSEASIAGAPHPPSGLPKWLQTQARTHGAAYSYNRATVAIGISRTLLPASRFLRR